MSSLSDEQVRSWHEAAHAVVAHRLGGTIQSLTVESEMEGYEGAASVVWLNRSKKELALLSGLTALAGPLAELARFGADELSDRDDLAAWSADWAEVMRSAETLSEDEDGQRELIDAWVDRVRGMLDDLDTEEQIARVADALEAHGTLDETLFGDCIG